ncbi:MAG: acyl-CoA dehydrogenase family protein, partial [Deltaproteobacteria bacterium]|nr:acyl-CoA dehydrogenase family protein [Deltaproteobacteria bacterium]
MAKLDALQGTDLLLIDDLLGEEQQLVRRTVHAFVRDEVLPLLRSHFRQGTFPASLIPKIAELGLLGANLTGYGCAGMDPVSYGLAIQELERGDRGIRSFVSVQGALVMYPIHEYGSEEQRQRWLPAMARGEAIGCFGL